MEEREGGGGHNSRLLDRSKVKILVCDSDPKSSQEVIDLLRKCSYQVTSVRSARQVIDVLNSQGSEIDIILAEVDLPVSKGYKMLKYIACNKDHHRIPIIMMSSQDEVSVVVKCLRLGAADFLVKPLRTNELLNLWTHMWRRRRMLGLSEKDIFNHELDPVLSDPSDANTNSTALLSDDTEDKQRDMTNQETSISNHPEHYESKTSALEPEGKNVTEDVQVVRQDETLALFSGKTNLRVAESSAFLAYVKSTTPATSTDQSQLLDRLNSFSNREAQDNIYDQITLIPDLHKNEEQQQTPPVFHLPVYYQAMVDPGGLNVNSLQIFQSHPYNVFPQYHQFNNMIVPPYQYNHTVGMGLQPGPAWQPPPPAGAATSASEGMSGVGGRTERRAAALVKFRQKRKERCFDKKIRYVNRKKLAETRPRVRGQFVRQGSGIDVNLSSNGDENSEEYVDLTEEPTSREFDSVSVSSL